MTSVNGTNAANGGEEWRYDITVYPKNATGNPTLEKTVREAAKDTGKNNGSAVDDGYRKARTAILDANLTTIIAGLVMMLVGPTPIKNFATTLLAGVIISMFTAIVVTRYFMKVLMKLGVKSPKLLALKEGKADEK